MGKKKSNYFKLIEKQALYCVEASELLQDILKDYSGSDISIHRKKMHEIENEADKAQHDILTKLSTEFITPIDQEDILRLVQIVDDITDALDEVVLGLYMFHIDTVPKYTAKLLKAVNGCVDALHDALKELKNFKKPSALRSLLVKVNDIEAEGDTIYIEAIHELFGSAEDSRTLYGNKAIYDGLENCCDLCEYAADIIEQIIIKNT